jgi:hypothetical protein
MTFKEAVRQLINRATDGGVNSAMPYSNGLCYNLSELTEDSNSESYYVMQVVMTCKAYAEGLGPSKVFTEDRLQMLEHLKQLTYPDYLRLFACKMEKGQIEGHNLVSSEFFGE